MGLSEKEECVLLDKKLLVFMDQLELLEEKRERLNSLIEQGWFSMSKARYSMGNKQVSALQYGSEMEPLVRVHTRTLESGEAEFQTKRRTLKCPEERQVEDIGPKDKEGVRRRVKTQEVPDQSDNNDPWTETEPATSSKPEPNPQQDPLKWFGILVPQTLKQAQASFKQVVELSAEMAALQSAVLTTRQQLQMKQKSRSQNSDQTDRLT
ncbi:coiled-coil domain-containing protein 115 isoform X1 [Salvelinus fontinalis]|uniref:coiled-coil domain-containing protein 115 isoform X1 n=1 Tax=Salvelinus fontinalis TaxID=8038 RepID=UPI002485E1C2|nr:coiled-coil domain-containing protein 115 isoform X1 [Salvelinus fontinalis]